MDIEEVFHKGNFPAFPVTIEFDHGTAYHHGMTLRDWFATHASEEDIKEYRESHSVEVGESYHSCFGECQETRTEYKYTREQSRYRYADAMLAARNNNTENKE